VVIAFNEEDCLSTFLEEVVTALGDAEIDYELILVDDGSTDGTGRIMADLASRDDRVRVHRQPNLGIGGALRSGYDVARGEYVTWVPADGQIAPEVVLRLFRQRHEAMLLSTVYRSRADSWHRVAISGVLRSMMRLRGGRVGRKGGNYLFHHSAWERYAPRNEDSMMLNPRFQHNIRVAGESVVEIEIDCRARLAGRSKVMNVRTILRTFGALVRGSQ